MKSVRYLAGSLLAASVAVAATYWPGAPEPDPLLLAADNPLETEEAMEEASKDTASPGFYEQWFDMRKNEDGIIPYGLYSQWAAHDAQQSTSRSSALSNVTQLGPNDEGGRTRALLVDAADDDRYFAGSVSGGLWVSTNRGDSWSPINDQASSLSVTGITQNPFDSDDIYYCTGEPSGSARGFPGRGIFKSTNGGSSFSLLSATDNGNFESCWKIAHSRTEDDVVVVTTDSDGIWRTTDGGANWSKEYSTNREVNDLIALPNGDFFATIRKEGIYRSTDDGDSWTEITNGLPSSGFHRIAIAFCENSPSVLYALYAKDWDEILNVYKSTNGGTSWSVTSGQPDKDNGQTDYNLVIGVSATNSSRVFVGAVDTDYSLNGGNNWYSTNAGHFDYHAFAHDPSNNSMFMVANDAGVYRKRWTNMGSSATELNDGYKVTQFYAGDYFETSGSDYNVIAGTQDNGTWRRRNTSWKRIHGSDGGYSQASIQNDDLAYIETQEGKIRRTTNLQSNNPSFTNIYSDITSQDNTLFIAPFEINRTDGEQVYFLSRDRLWRTTNRGSDWDAISNNHGTLYGVGVTTAPDPTVYIGGDNANIYRIDNATSADAGDEVNLSGSVPSTVTGSTISDIKPHPTDLTKAYVTFSSINPNGRVWRVDDIHTSSPTWVDISSNLPSQLPCNTMEVHPANDDVLFVGTDFGLYCSDDGGDSWSKETSLPNVAVFQLQLREEDGRLFIFTHGRGAWRASTNSGPQRYAELPYTTGFETGLDQYWTTSNDDDSRVKVTPEDGPHSGNQHLTLDTESGSGTITNEADLHLDLSGENQVELRFWWKNYNDEYHSADGIYFSDNGGSSFTKVHSLSGSPYNSYNQVVLDVDDLASNNGKSLTNDFVIRFSQRDNSPIAGDGFGFDDISVSAPGGATVPYYTGFEGGFDGNWTTSSTDPSRGRVQVTSAHGPHSGSDHLTMDVSSGGSAVNQRADLHIDLSGETDVELRFWWKDIGDENHDQDAIYFSDNGGSSFKRVHFLKNGPDNYTEVVLDLDELADDVNRDLTDEFVIRFQQRDNWPISSDGFAFDDVSVVHPSGSKAIPDVPVSTTNPLLPNVVDPWMVAMYPNPASTEVFLTISGDGANEPANVVVYDMQGRVVRQQQQLTAGAGSPNHVSIEDLSPGTYLVEVTSAENQEVHRLVKP